MAITPKIKILRSSSGLLLGQGDIFLVRYQGHIVDSSGKNGIEFDANYNFSTFTPIPDRTPFEFQLGSGSVIQGWEMGLTNRRIGEIVGLVIPPSLGYGNTARAKIPANSTLRFRIEIIGGFTASIFTPSTGPRFTFASLKDWGITARNLGLTAQDIFSISSSTVGLNTVDVLTGKDVDQDVNSAGAGKDLLIGLGGNDQITGGLGGDLLIGGKGKDIFRYRNLNESLLSSYDRILDLRIGVDRIDGPMQRPIKARQVKQLGKISELSQDGLQKLLGSENTELGRRSFPANQAATFSMGSGSSTRTFLAINDNMTGFNASTDGLIEITGFSGNLNGLAIF